MNYSNSFAFKDYIFKKTRTIWIFIDMTPKRRVPVDKDYFTLMEFSAKWDPTKHALSKSHTISQRIYGTNDRFW
jgi:hypothetical protein